MISLAQKVAIYIRVSTVHQIDKDSLQVQRRELAAFCEYVLGIHDFVVFEDKGYSAKNTDRPDYQAMMTRIRSGEFSHLLVWKIDRISRNLLDFTSMYSELKKLGVTFISKNEQFDTSTAIGEAMLKIILVFAELERKMTSERVTAVMTARAVEGKWNGGRVPYGYKWDKQTKTFSIDSVEGEIVREMFSLYHTHHSLLYVAKLFNDAGKYNRTGNPWSAVMIHKMFTNPFYYGAYRYNNFVDGERMPESDWLVMQDHHPAIISKETFEETREILMSNRRGTAKSYTRKHIHVFAGLAYCGHCGAKMHVTTDRPRESGFRPTVYSCPNRKKQTCECKYVNDSIVAPFIFSLLSAILKAAETKDFTSEQFCSAVLSHPIFTNVKNVVGLDALYKKSHKADSPFIFKPSFKSQEEENVDALTKRKQKNEAALERLKGLYLFGDDAIPAQEYIAQRNELIKEIEQIEKQLAKTAVSVSPDFEAKASYFIVIKQLLSDEKIDYDNYIRKLDPSVLKAFVNTVLDGFTIAEGRVSSVRFKNKVTLQFEYKEKGM